MNIFACLVHEAPDCVRDLVDNLLFLDPGSVVLLYDGSGGNLLPRLGMEGRPGVVVYPQPRAMKWGRLHDFAIDCMRYALEHLEFEAMTIVDSDQLALRQGYSAYLHAFLEQHPDAGCLVSSERAQPPSTTIGPARVAWQEVELWRPFLNRFAGGVATFPQWTFWPSTVFTRAAAGELVRLWEDEELQDILAKTTIWASEEVILPSLVALTGHRVIKSPCSYDLVQYRAKYSVAQFGPAMSRRDVFWAHPVPRVYGDPLRAHVRKTFGGYSTSLSTPPMSPFGPSGQRPLPLVLPLIKSLETIDGWLSAAEADLLGAAVTRALTDLPSPHAIVEVGSYCGKATVVLGTLAKALSPGATVHAVDPHDGLQGERGKIVRGLADSRARFTRNIEQAGLTDVVHHIVAEARHVTWDEPISLLVVDRLHDYASVAADFAQFQNHLVPGGLVAFHDYAEYFPGVEAFVGHLLTTGAYTPVQRVESMVILQKTRTVILPSIGTVLAQIDVVDGHFTHDEAALLSLTVALSFSASGSGVIVEVGARDPRATRVLSNAALAARRPGPCQVTRSGGSIFVGAEQIASTEWRRKASTPGRPVANSGAVDGDITVSGPEEICLLVANADSGGLTLAQTINLLLRALVPGGYVVLLNVANSGMSGLYGELLRTGELQHVFARGHLVVLRRTRSPNRAGVGEPRAVAPHPRKKAHLANADGNSNKPLVSCVMPTHDRRPLVERAIRCWLRQDYTRSELIVVDDGTDRVGDIVPDDPRVHYVPLPQRQTIGAKRNIGCQRAEGELIVHWDDDDWSAPWRVGYQVEMFLKQDVDVSGLSAVFFCDLEAGKAWRYEYPFQRRPWVADATFCYRRSFWQERSFPDSSYGIDTTYLWQGPAKRVAALADPSFYVAMVHPGNTSRKDVRDAWWHPHPISEIASLMGPDWERYQQPA
ncbi:MAG TPA: glycosyltransferase [Acidimicrobiales bacterium]|nr:glycosyltransferase [Acidimicrobiales bacterium]